MLSREVLLPTVNFWNSHHDLLVKFIHCLTAQGRLCLSFLSKLASHLNIFLTIRSTTCWKVYENVIQGITKITCDKFGVIQAKEFWTEEKIKVKNHLCGWKCKEKRTQQLFKDKRKRNRDRVTENVFKKITSCGAHEQRS